jgi:hypothetical protein
VTCKAECAGEKFQGKSIEAGLALETRLDHTDGHVLVVTHLRIMARGCGGFVSLAGKVRPGNN